MTVGEKDGSGKVFWVESTMGSRNPVLITGGNNTKVRKRCESPVKLRLGIRSSIIFKRMKKGPPFRVTQGVPFPT